jgi:hypothetical protein
MVNCRSLLLWSIFSRSEHAEGKLTPARQLSGGSVWKFPMHQKLSRRKIINPSSKSHGMRRLGDAMLREPQPPNRSNTQEIFAQHI